MGFTPLALIVDASHDSHYGPNLPSKVVAPLMTANAIDLLVNCLTSKESELWHSLGEPWYIPLEEWKDYVQPYRPVFMDGWSPSVSYPENGEKILGSSVVAPPLHHSVDDPDFVERRTPEVYPVDGGLRKRNNAVEVDHLRIRTRMRRRMKTIRHLLWRRKNNEAGLTTYKTEAVVLCK